MSATDELRRLLDERGVEWGDIDTGGKRSLITLWHGAGGMEWQFYENTKTNWTLLKSRRDYLTPERAVEATLGRGNVGKYVGLRRGKNWERTEYSDYYCGGCGWKVTDHDSYCPECGGALHEATLGHSSNCTNSERTTTVDETERISISWQDGRHVTIRVMECGACGGTYEHVNGGYEFCPRCGRRIVEVDE